MTVLMTGQSGKGFECNHLVKQVTQVRWKRLVTMPNLPLVRLRLAPRVYAR